MSLCEARKIHKVYRQAATEVRVLRGVDLAIEEGEVLAIVGPSGAGKSTLLHILGGLDEPSEGEVFFKGDNIYRMRDRERSRIRNCHFGFIFQFYHLLPEFSALENVMLPGRVRGDGGPDLRHRAEGLLDQVGLSARLTHKPSELSGGEQQRVAIARALANDPEVLFCDEPTGNLDSESGRGIIRLLLDINQARRQTLVIVTHDAGIARQSGRVVHMKDGSFVQPADGAASIPVSVMAPDGNEAA